jgi:hypothetical protein
MVFCGLATVLWCDPHRAVLERFCSKNENERVGHVSEKSYDKSEFLEYDKSEFSCFAVAVASRSQASRVKLLRKFCVAKPRLLTTKPLVLSNVSSYQHTLCNIFFKFNPTVK